MKLIRKRNLLKLRIEIDDTSKSIIEFIESTFLNLTANESTYVDLLGSEVFGVYQIGFSNNNCIAFQWSVIRRFLTNNSNLNIDEFKEGIKDMINEYYKLDCLEIGIY